MAVILIIEDDTDINNMIRDTMEQSGYGCLQAFSGTEGILVAQMQNPDLIILDLMLPGKNGETVLYEIKKERNMPVIVLSAKDSIDSKVELLRSGAEDYMTKPFDIKELMIRVEVQLRRYRELISVKTGDVSMNTAGRNDSAKKAPTTENILKYGEIEMNQESYGVLVAGSPIELTKHEFRILEMFIKNPDRAFSKQAIYDYAWDDSYLGEDKTINVHISNIRKKIKAVTDTEYIDTVWGIGFKLKKL